jgi:hypothetical protein
MPLSGLVASRKQPKRLGEVSLTFRQMLALIGCTFSPPSGRPTQPPLAMSRP